MTLIPNDTRKTRNTRKHTPKIVHYIVQEPRTLLKTTLEFDKYNKNTRNKGVFDNKSATTN